MKRALLVIDMQNVCVGGDHAKMFQYDNEKLINNVNERIAMYDSNDVIYIKNIMKKSFINRFAPFVAYEGSKEAELADGLHVVNQNVVCKYKGDAFTNPQLIEMLKAAGIEELELTGVDGGGCVALTAFGAVRNGYKAAVVSGAVGTMFLKRAGR